VAVGDELAALDGAELQAQLRAAKAGVTAARARLHELERGFREEEIAQGRAALRAAERRLENTRQDADRGIRLYEGGAISRQQYENLQTALTLAQSESESAEERVRILERGPRREQVEAQRAVVAQGEAVVAQVDVALRNTVIRAPFAGIVTVRHRQVGEIVGAGVPVATVMNPDDRWIRIYVQENLVGRLAIGTPATITADAFPDRRYGGRVVFIASDAEFTPRNVQTTAERVKLVYRVKVQVTDDPSFDLKPGLPADVVLDTSPR
jgi:HlyD family secretion protein